MKKGLFEAQKAQEATREDVFAAQEKRIANILQRADSELNAIDGQILEAQNKIRVCEGQVEKAVKTGDLDAYSTAKAMMQLAKDAEEMNCARKKALQETPLLEPEELKKEVDELHACVNADRAETQKKLFEMAEEMEQVGKAFNERIKRANAILADFQQKIAKRDNSSYISFDARELTAYASVAVRNLFYQMRNKA